MGCDEGVEIERGSSHNKKERVHILYPFSRKCKQRLYDLYHHDLAPRPNPLWGSPGTDSTGCDSSHAIFDNLAVDIFAIDHIGHDRERPHLSLMGVP